MKDMKARHLLGDARNEAAGVYMHTNTHTFSPIPAFTGISSPSCPATLSGSLKSALAPILRFFFPHTSTHPSLLTCSATPKLSPDPDASLQGNNRERRGEGDTRVKRARPAL